MRKILLSTMVSGMLSCSSIFCMENNMPSEEKENNQLNASNKPPEFYQISDFEEEKNISLTLGGLSEETNFIQTIQRLKNDMRKEWILELDRKSDSEIFDDKDSEIFDELQKVYDDMEVSKLLSWGKNLRYGTAAYFAWLNSVQGVLEDKGVFELIIGNEFGGIKDNRKNLQDACNDLEERLNDIKKGSECCAPELKVNYETCCEIIQNKINGIQTRIANKQTPVEGFISKSNTDYLEEFVASIEEWENNIKSFPITRINGDRIVRVMFRSQIKNFCKLLCVCNESVYKDSIQINNLKDELLTIIHCKQDFLCRQKKINEFAKKFLLSFKELIKNNTKENSIETTKMESEDEKTVL